jgi:APA family basic amino acid/polyamine antiporter
LTAGTEPARHLTLLDATSLYVGIILGSGIFLAPAAVAGATRSPLAAIALWLAGAIVAACGASCYAECAIRMPQNGGFFVFHREAFGPGVAFVGGWASIFVTYPASIAAIALVCARHLGEAAGSSGHERAFGAAALVAAGVVNAWGLRTGPRAQIALTATKLSVLAALAVAALWAPAHAPAGGPEGAGAATVPGATWIGALLVLLWSYDGWSDLSLVAGEVRDPGRVLGRAALLGSTVLFSIYALVQVAVQTALPGGAAAASSRPVADAVASTLGPAAGRSVAGLVVVATFGSILGTGLAVSRLGHAMAREGAFLRWFGAIDPHTKTPVRATAAMTAASLVYVASSGFRGILTLFSFSVWIFYGLTAVAVFVLRRRAVGGAAAWRAPGGPLAPLVVLAAGAYLTNRIVAADPKRALLGAAVIAAAVPVYAAARWRERRISARENAGK